MAEHELKAWPEYFEQVLSGAKPFEVRKADRPFAVGDVLWLREYDPDADRHTGRECRRRVTYILPGGAFGIAAGFSVLGLDQDAAESKGYERAREQAVGVCLAMEAQSTRYDFGPAEVRRRLEDMEDVGDDGKGMASAIAAAHTKGYGLAREQAAKVADDNRAQAEAMLAAGSLRPDELRAEMATAEEIRDDIRAMTPEGER